MKESWFSRYGETAGRVFYRVVYDVALLAILFLQWRTYEAQRGLMEASNKSLASQTATQKQDF